MKKILIFPLLVMLVGCAKQSVPDGLPKLVPVTLTITQKGTPLADAVVSLVDPSGSIPFTVGGTTDAAGNVVLHTHGLYKGAPLGKFKVRVVKTESDSTPQPMTMAEIMSSTSKGQPPPKTYSLIEKQYTSSETTPLELEITGPATMTLDIGKAVKEVTK